MPAVTDLHILSVDDFPEMRWAIRKLLRRLGYKHIVEADNGKTALSILRAEKISFVILDWNLPEMTGIDLLKVIRTDRGMQDIPVLMVSGEATKASIVEALDAGANNYIVKPFTAETLQEKIETIFVKS